MTDVSCRVFDIFLRDLKSRGLAPETLVAGTGCTTARIANRHERIEWATYVAIMTNAKQIWNDDDFRRLGGAFFRNPLIRPLLLVGQLLFSLKDFYKFIATAKGGGNTLFTCVHPSYRELAPEVVEITLVTAPNYQHCREFFIICQGSYVDLPRAFGAPPAKVGIQFIEGGARFEITLPRTNRLLSWVRKVILWPVSTIRVARELKDANSELLERVSQLQLAQARLNDSARQLRTANTINNLVHAETDLDLTLKSVTEALVNVAGFAAARIEVRFRSSDAAIERVSATGNASGQAFKRLELAARGVNLGMLDVWDGEGTPTNNTELFDNILPSICMAIDESIAFTLLTEYRANLEQKVAERTYELSTAHDRLTDTVKDLEEAQAVRSRIFANINHEIRTPLSLVLLAAGEIRGRHLNKNDPKTLGSVTNIEAACERLLSMVDSMLLLAAGQEGKLKIHKRSCDIAIETRRLVSIWTPLARQHKLNMSYRGPDRLDAFLDTAALERVLANLLSNAIKYTPDGGTIDVELVAGESQSEIFVRDTGIGIDEEFKKRIFGRFEQGRAAVRHGARSTGIGLSIVKELVEAHGGSVSVDANRGGGTVFRLAFPLVAEEDRVETPAEAPPFTGHSLPAGFGLQSAEAETPTVLFPDGPALATLLVAEDDNGLRSSIGELLRGAGYKVFLAQDGFAALRLATEHYPDMLVSDVGMPGMDGLTLSTKFRELPGNRLAPVLLLTAYGTTTDKLSGFRAGAIDYVTKPFEPKELIARVESQLKLRDMALRLSRSEKLASLGTMSAGLAHEMRNPANGLLNALDPLVSLLPAEITAADSGTGQLMEVIRDCAQQIGRLSKQLLGFKNDGAVICTEESVQHLVRRALSMVDAKRGGVEVRVRHAYGDTVRCAAPLLLQVLVNLLDNAIHAAGKGGWVEVTTRLDGQRVIFDVRDSGKGVPPELRERIFEPFFSTKAPGVGTGLGLSTSRYIIEQHQGVLRVVEDTHSTFRVELPLNGPDHGAVAVSGPVQDQPRQVAAS